MGKEKLPFNSMGNLWLTLKRGWAWHQEYYSLERWSPGKTPVACSPGTFKSKTTALGTGGPRSKSDGNGRMALPGLGEEGQEYTIEKRLSLAKFYSAESRVVFFDLE